MAAQQDDIFSWRLQGTIYAAGFFNGNVFSIAAVVMPLWALALGASPLMIGILLGARQALLIFFGIHGGAMMDKFGARRVIVVMGCLGTVTTALFPVFPFIAAAILLQMLSGLAESLNWIGVQTMVGQALRGQAVYAGRLTFIARIGGFVGPPLVGAAWDLFGGWGMFIAMTAWVASGWLAAWMVPETGGAADRPAGDGAKTRFRDLMPKLSDYVDTFRLMAIGAVALVVLATVVRQTGSAMQASFYVVWLDSIGISGTAIGVLFSISSVISAFSALTVGPITRVVRSHWLLLAMVLLSIVSMAVTPLLGSYAMLMLWIGLRGFSQGLNLPLLISIGATAVGRESQGKMVALRITVNRTNAALVPVVMGGIAEFTGLANSFYVIGAIGCALLGILALWVVRSPAFRAGD